MGNCCAWRLLLTLPENSWSLLNELLSLQAETAPLVVPWLNAERFTFPIVWLIQNTRGEERTSILSGQFWRSRLFKGNDLLGMIVIYRLEVSPFTDKQIALVETFADQAAIAIENGRLFDALRQRTDELGQSVGELRALGEVSQAVNSTLDLETVLSTIVAKAVQLSSTEAGAIYVFDDRQRGVSPARHLRHGSGVN